MVVNQIRRGDGSTDRATAKDLMPRRAILRAVLLAAAVSAAGSARAQSADEPLRRLDERTLGLSSSGAGRGAAAGVTTTAGQGAPLAGGDYGADPSNAAQLAGGDYGQPTPDPGDLAGGDYGEPRRAPEDEEERRQGAPGPIAPSYLADPLAAGPGGFRRPLLRRPSAPVDDAYAPTGIRAGSFVLRPTLETAAGYDDNPRRVHDDVKGSSFFRLRGELDAQSDWSRHELDFQSSAQIRRYPDAKSLGYQPELASALSGRLDVTDRTQINAQLRASLSASQPGDPETSGVEGEEISRSVGATLGVAHRFNRLSLRLDGLADRYTVGDSKATDGSKIDNSDRAYNAYQARLRASYELSPKLQPFVEASVDTRDYDKKFDDAGDRLGSNGYAIRGGAQFEATRLVTGEIGLGYGRQTPKQSGATPVDGLLIDGNIAWAPTALTTVRAAARTSLQETNLTTSTGILDRVFEVSLEHQFRRNFAVTARGVFERADYKGSSLRQDSFTASLEGEYKINRDVALTGSFERVWLNSSERGNDYVASIIEFGLKFRR